MKRKEKKKNKDQSVDTLPLLRIGNKTPMEGVTETKFGAETKGWTFLVHCHCLQTHQKRASDPITDGCEPPCGCWELNSGPLEEQSVLLTTELSL